jgi:hypothetical protein
MPSHAHQSLLLWGVRSMMSDGFRIAGFDGRIDQAGELNRLPAPIEVQGVRPDAYGISREDGILGFVEAKTHRDIDNQHTRCQLRVLGYARMRDGKHRCSLYVAIPRSCAYALDRVLLDVGLLRSKHLRRIHVPDILLDQ